MVTDLNTLQFLGVDVNDAIRTTPNIDANTIEEIFDGVDGTIYLIGGPLANIVTKKLLADTTLAASRDKVYFSGYTSIDFLTTGREEGYLFDTSAPAIRVVNSFGTNHITRKITGSDIEDYGVIFVLQELQSDKTIIICAGISAISTKATAFVVSSLRTNLGLIYRNGIVLPSSTNTFIIKTNYDVSIMSPDEETAVERYSPDASNIDILRPEDINLGNNTSD